MIGRASTRLPTIASTAIVVAFRMHREGATEQIETLVAELNGVRAYFRRGADGRLEVIITTMDLQL